MLGRPRIRQLTLGELFDESFRIYRRDLLTLIALTALVIVPYTIINVLITLPLQQNLAALTRPGTVPDEQFFTTFFSSLVYSAGLAGSFGFLYSIVFVPLMEGALTHAVTRRYLDQPVSIGTSIGGALRRALPLIGAKFLPSLAIGIISLLFFGVIIFGFLGAIVGNPFSNTAFQNEPSGATVALGFLLLFMAFVVFFALYVLVYVRILFTSQAVIAENKGPFEAIKRSWNLTKGYWWRTFGILLLIGILAFLISFVPTAIFGAIYGIIAARSGGIPNLVQQQVFNSVISAITSVLVTPFSLIAYTLMYYDLRIRKEGFDLEHQARALMPDPNTGYTQPFNP